MNLAVVIPLVMQQAVVSADNVSLIFIEILKFNKFLPGPKVVNCATPGTQDGPWGPEPHQLLGCWSARFAGSPSLLPVLPAGAGEQPAQRRAASPALSPPGFLR